MVIQVESYQLFGIVQGVHYIMLANDEIMSYANKLRFQTGAMPSFKLDLTTPCLFLFLKSKLIWKNDFTEAVNQHHI